MREQYYLVIHPKAFGPINHAVELHFRDQLDEAKYVWEALDNAGEQVELLREQIGREQVLVSRSRAKS